jgi:CubicO group peptidase (beta-lactamase class C family)
MIRYLLLCFGWIALANPATAQTPYFPPLLGNTWEATDPADLGWCTPALDDLQTFLGERHTKAFLILKDGKRVVEWYFDDFVQDSLWYWASAGKSLMATMVGIAQEEGLLAIEDATQDYLGAGWTSTTPEQEQAITIRHQLTMTTGFNDLNVDVDCTEPACLTYLAPPGTRWAYHNAPYTLLGDVIAAAAGVSENQFFASRIGNKIGAFGAYVGIGSNRVFISRARDMARFGLLILNRGQWNNTTVLGDMDYFTAMTTPSQDINPAYGYLWWLNGQDNYQLPRLQFSFGGSLIPSAPADMFAALGKNDQKIYVVPSQGLVVVRMGNDASGGVLALSDFDPLLWDKISQLACATATQEAADAADAVVLAPNPAGEMFTILSREPVQMTTLFDLHGQQVRQSNQPQIAVAQLPAGMYWAQITLANGQEVMRKVMIR